MPTITNANGTAITKRGFMILSFFRPLIAFRFRKREVAGPKINTFVVNPEPKSLPPFKLVFCPFSSYAPKMKNKV